MKIVDVKEGREDEDGSASSQRSRSSTFTHSSSPPELQFTVQLTAADAASEDFFKPEPKKVKKIDLKVVLAQAEVDAKFYRMENALFEQHIMRVSAKAANEARLRVDDIESDGGDTLTDLESDSGVSRSSTRSRATRAWARMSSTDFSVVEDLRKNHIMFRNSSFSISDFSRASKDPSKLKIKEVQPLHALSNEEKIQIARIETRLLKSRIITLQNDSERTSDDLQALYDEAQLRIGRARRDRADFLRDIMVEAKASPCGKASAEKVLRFLEQKMKDTRFSITKTKSRNAALQVAIVRTEKNVEDKQDIKDLLQPIDFDQMAIINKQTLANLRSHAHEIQRLKQTYFENSKTLLSLQNQLSYLDGEMVRVVKTIAQRSPNLEDVEREIINGNATLERIQEELHQLTIQEIHGAGQPHVLEYMHVRCKAHELHRIAYKWTRKIEIANFALFEISKMILKLKKKASVIVNPIAYNPTYAAQYFHNRMQGTVQ